MFFHHGHQIIKELPVASGLCTEQPSEHCNKIVTGNREHHSRQNSVANSLADVFNRQHYSADPKILSLMTHFLFLTNIKTTYKIVLQNTKIFDLSQKRGSRQLISVLGPRQKSHNLPPTFY